MITIQKDACCSCGKELEFGIENIICEKCRETTKSVDFYLQALKPTKVYLSLLTQFKKSQPRKLEIFFEFLVHKTLKKYMRIKKTLYLINPKYFLLVGCKSFILSNLITHKLNLKECKYDIKKLLQSRKYQKNLSILIINFDKENIISKLKCEHLEIINFT